MHSPVPATVTIIPFIVEPYAAVCDTIKELTEECDAVVAKGQETYDLRQGAQLFSNLGAQWVYSQYITKEISFKCNPWLTE